MLSKVPNKEVSKLQCQGNYWLQMKPGIDTLYLFPLTLFISLFIFTQFSNLGHLRQINKVAFSLRNLRRIAMESRSSLNSIYYFANIIMI
jgi:hypothetical protein